MKKSVKKSAKKAVKTPVKKSTIKTTVPLASSYGVAPVFPPPKVEPAFAREVIVEQPTVQFTVQDEVVETGMIVATKEAVKPQATTAASLDEMYDRYQKKVYLFDVSGSMRQKMAPEKDSSAYIFTPEILDEFKKVIRHDFISDAVDEQVVDDEDLDSEDIAEEAEDKAEDTMEELGLMLHGSWQEDRLKEWIVEHMELMKSIAPNIELKKRSSAYDDSSERKIEAVQGAMTKFIRQRFQKFPDAQVGVMTFAHEGTVKTLCHPGATQDEVLAAVERLPDMIGGGTSITPAVKAVVDLFKHRPSRVQAHHLILVSDGEDYGAVAVEKLLPQFKELNIVFDFIYIQGQSDEVSHSDAVKVLKKACEVTGGEYQVCSKSSDFEMKFLAASNRRALPPGRFE